MRPASTDWESLTGREKQKREVNIFFKKVNGGENRLRGMTLVLEARASSALAIVVGRIGPLICVRLSPFSHFQLNTLERGLPPGSHPPVTGSFPLVV